MTTVPKSVSPNNSTGYRRLPLFLRRISGLEVRLTLRAESINLLNAPQFAEPGSVLGTPEFGFITNTLNDGRTVRFEVSLGW